MMRQSTRRTVRRARRHALLAAGSSGAVYAVFLALDSEDPLIRLSMATAYAGLALLAVTLVLGPLNVLRDRPNPVSTYLRRDIGIWAGALGLIHVGVGLQVHLRGNMAHYFVYPPDWERALPLRYDLFGLANWAGLGAGLLLVLLLALSNDASLRRLGSRRWKSLQRWNYGVFALVVAHGAGYQVVESRSWTWVAVFAALAVAALASQFAGYRALRRKRETHDRQGSANGAAPPPSGRPT